ncbi:MAG TPA: prepilin-type N-terminal cleavage/methylation domain-containing protein [Gammaproteobacteria bacterium]
MMKQQSGFTLIELIMVIVVLAALAVTAIPRYINLQAQAVTGALNGVAGSLASGSAINFADCTANPASATCLIGAGVMDNCTHVAATLVGGALPSANYNITAAALNAGTGSTTTCTLNNTSVTPNQSVTFTAITP